MSPRRRHVLSAGIALLRSSDNGVEVLLVHPGGPYWQNKDANAWSVPKGELDQDPDRDPSVPVPEDDIEAAARREFVEETGGPAPDGPLVALPEIRLGSSSKRLRCFAVAGDLDPEAIVSNTFEMEWPPRSGRTVSFPEVDRAAWFTLDEARDKLHKGQLPLVDLLAHASDAVLGLA